MLKKRNQKVNASVSFAGGDGVGSFAKAIYQMMALKEMEKKNANNSLSLDSGVVYAGGGGQQIDCREVVA